MAYYGAEKVVEHYNIMRPIKQSGVELIREGSRRKELSTQSLNRNAKTKTAYPKFIHTKERL